MITHLIIHVNVIILNTTNAKFQQESPAWTLWPYKINKVS